MTNVDYVLVGPGPSSDEVQEAVARITDSVLTPEGKLYPVIGRPTSFLRVLPDRESPGGTAIHVFFASQPVAERHELARSIHRGLAEATDWDLRLDCEA